MLRNLGLRIAVLGAVLLLAACADPRAHTRAVYMMIDTSGTYAKQVDKAKAIINYLLGTLEPGDSFAVAKIQSRSFTETGIIEKVTFDRRPSTANAQKRAFQHKIAGYTHTVVPSAHTDITGALIQGAEYLNETGAGEKTILIFSDMEEDLDAKTVRNFPIKLTGIRIVAVNVTKLRTDNIDPRLYLNRLDWWHKRVMDAGAKDWRVINDLEHLDRALR